MTGPAPPPPISGTIPDTVVDAPGLDAHQRREALLSVFFGDFVSLLRDKDDNVNFIIFIYFINFFKLNFLLLIYQCIRI